MIKRRRNIAGQSNGEIQTHIQYPNRLNFYNIPPAENLTIDEFEAHAVDRLKVLTKLQKFMEQKKPSRETEKLMRPILMELMPLSMNAKMNQLETERKKDHYSHFILRLCFCRNTASQPDWIKTEVALFRLRYLTATDQERREFIDSLPLDLHKCSKEELQELGKPGQLIFKVNWTRVPDLVADRKVTLHKGTAYIENDQLINLLTNEFRNSLESSLLRMGRTIGRLDEQDRLLPIMDHISAAFQWPLSSNQVEALDGVNAETIDVADKANMLPMCMSVMHRQNKAIQHAKFKVRNEFTLFMKHMGLPIDEALKYWSKVLTKDKAFDTNVYQFKHRYGMAGSNVQYKPTQCAQLARESDKQNNCGCPFKYMNASDLRQQLIQRGVNDKQDLQFIEESNSKHQFHLSCARVFAVTQKVDRNDVETVVNPNEYFARAWDLKNPK